MLASKSTSNFNIRLQTSTSNFRPKILNVNLTSYRATLPFTKIHYFYSIYFTYQLAIIQIDFRQQILQNYNLLTEEQTNEQIDRRIDIVTS